SLVVQLHVALRQGISCIVLRRAARTRGEQVAQLVQRLPWRLGGLAVGPRLVGLRLVLPAKAQAAEQRRHVVLQTGLLALVRVVRRARWALLAGGGSGI